jgi:two-component system cell cycle sensor histidine kinase/response regulator CckA
MNPLNSPCSLNILHLEDDPLQTELLKTEIESRNIPCSITRVWSRDAFDAALANGQIDVIIADWAPGAGASGFDHVVALVEARRRCPSVPFIFFAQEEVAGLERLEALRQGAFDFISKSAVQKLARALNWALHLKREKRPRFLKPEVGVPVLVQCKDFRFLGYLDAEGLWRDYQTSEIITGVTGWSAA